MRARSCFPTHVRTLAQRQDDKIGFLRARHRSRDLFVGSVKNARPFEANT